MAFVMSCWESRTKELALCIARLRRAILLHLDPASRLASRVEPGDRAYAFDSSKTFAAYQTVFEGLIRAADR